MVSDEFGSFSEYQEAGTQMERPWPWTDKFGSAITSTEGNSQARQKGYVENVIPYQITENIFPAEPLGLLKFSEDEQYAD